MIIIEEEIEKKQNVRRAATLMTHSNEWLPMPMYPGSDRTTATAASRFSLVLFWL